MVVELARITNIDLINFAYSKIGVPYVYGMKGSLLTREKYRQLKQQYGSLVWNSDAKKIGQVCCDCSGLISWATGIMRGSSQYKAVAKRVHPIQTITEAPKGALVWQKGHIGIYIGLENGIPYYIAEDGSAYGCRKAKLSQAHFTHWFLCTDIDYIKESKQSIQKDGEEEMVRYNTINEIPQWGKNTIQKMIDKKLFADINKLDISDDMLRIFIILDRNGSL